MTWKRLALRISALALLLMAFSALACAAGDPELRLPTPVHDFGTVSRGSVLRVELPVENRGAGELKILAVEAACGCTTTEDWPRTLAPGQTGRIALTLDTSQFSGPVSKPVTLRTNDPARSAAVLTLKATIWAPVTVLQPVLVFPAVTDPEQAVTRTTTVRSEEDAPLVIKAVTSANPRFKAEVAEKVPGKIFELVVSTVPPLVDGTHSSRITVETSSARMPVVTVQAVVTVLPAVHLAPDRIQLPPGRLTKPEKRYAVIQSRRGLAVELKNVETTVQGASLTQTPSADRTQVTIALTIPAGFEALPGDLHVLRGRTNLPGRPTFEIPIR